MRVLPLRALASNRWIVGFTLLGLALRIVYALVAHPPPAHLGDQGLYKRLAADFVGWWRSPDAFRTPGYPAFLAILRPLGLWDDGTRVVQGVIASAGCFLMALSAARVGGLRAGQATAALGAVYLPLLTLPALVLSDGLAAGLVAAGFFAVIEGRRRASRWAWVAASSTALAAATLVRPNLALTFLILLGAWLVATPGWRGRLRALAVAAIPVVVLFGPWVARNYDVLGHPAPLGKGNSQYLFVGGIHLPIDRTGGRYGAYVRALHFHSDEDLHGPLTAKQAAHQGPWSDLADNLAHRPLKQLSANAYWFRELWLVAFDDHAQYGRRPVIPWALTLASHALVLALALLGALLFRRIWDVRLVVITVALMTVPLLFVLPEPRYTAPMAMLLLMPAGMAASRLPSRRAWAHRLIR